MPEARKTEAREKRAGAEIFGGAQTVTLRDDLQGLDVAMQVLWGAEDRIIPAAHAEALPDAIKVDVIEGAGHMVHMEKPSAVNAQIEALIND